MVRNSTSAQRFNVGGEVEVGTEPGAHTGVMTNRLLFWVAEMGKCVSRKE